MSILALTILSHIPERDRLRVLREVKVQLEAYGADDAVADCADLIRHVEALRPRERTPLSPEAEAARRPLPVEHLATGEMPCDQPVMGVGRAVTTHRSREFFDDPARTWDGEGEG